MKISLNDEIILRKIILKNKNLIVNKINLKRNNKNKLSFKKLVKTIFFKILNTVRMIR